MSRPKSHEGCGLWFCNEEKHYARNRCARHYQNWLRTGKDIAERPEDLKNVLDVVTQMRDVLSEFIVGCLVSDSDTEMRRCQYCGRETPWQSENAIPAMHDEDCPVVTALILVQNTESVPMDYIVGDDV